MKRIKFIATGSNSAIGGFSYGDVAQCDDALADHLVNDARVAEYIVEAKTEESPKKPVRKGK